MDFETCKNDSGFNVIDKIVDSNSLLPERNSIQVCTKSSASSPSKLEAVVTNGSNHFQIECNGNKNTHSGFSLDKPSILLNNGIINETDKLTTYLNHVESLTLDRTHEPCERTANTECFDVEVTHQLDSVKPSQTMKDSNSNINIPGVEQEEKGAINGELSNQTLPEISQCVPNPPNASNDENGSLENLVSKTLEEHHNNKVCANTAVGHSLVDEMESNAVETKQFSSDAIVNCQSEDTLYSSENIDEYVSDEEEVYVEVDGIGDSDQASDAESGDEEEALVDESNSQIDHDCSKAVDVLIQNIEDKKPVSESLPEESDLPSLSLSALHADELPPEESDLTTLSLSAPQDELMSEELPPETSDEPILSLSASQDELMSDELPPEASDQPTLSLSAPQDELMSDELPPETSDEPTLSLSAPQDALMSKQLPPEASDQPTLSLSALHNELPPEESDLPTSLFLSTSQDDLMSDEVYEEVEADMDEELDSENQEEANNDNKMNVDGECVDSFTHAELFNSNENKELMDASVAKPFDQVLPVDVDGESSNKLKHSGNEESNCNEKKSGDSNESVVETELESKFAVDQDLVKHPESIGSTELKEQLNSESNFNVEKSADFNKNLEAVITELPVEDNLSVCLKIKSSIELKESISEERLIIKKNDEDVNDNKEEALVLDEDEEMNVSKESLTPSEEDKLLSTSINTEGNAQDNSKEMDSAMDVGGTASVPDANTDQVTISNCRGEEKAQEKIADAKSPQKALDDFDDEFESLVEEFVVKECTNENAIPESPESEILLEGSEDELDVIIDDYKANNSDDDCLIVEDTNKEIINVDYGSGKEKKVKSSPVKIDTRAATDVTKDIVRSISQQKSDAVEKLNLDSSNNKSNIELKDAVEKSVSNKEISPASDLNTQHPSKQPGDIQSTVDKSNASTFSDAIPKPNVGPSEPQIVKKSNTDINLSSELVNKSHSDKVTEENCARRNSLSNQSGKASADTTNCNDGLKSGCVPQRQHVEDELPDEGFSDDEGSIQEMDTAEIIIEAFIPSKEGNKSVTDSSVKNFIEGATKKRMMQGIESIHSLEKKLKLDEIAIELPYDAGSKLQRKIHEKSSELVVPFTSKKVMTTKKILDLGTKVVIAKILKDLKIKRAKESVDKAEVKFQVFNECRQLFDVKIRDLVISQDEKFTLANFQPQVQTRTVGVNVKIFRECDLLPDYLYGTANGQRSGQIPTMPNNRATPHVSVGKSLLTPNVASRPNVPVPRNNVPVPRNNVPVPRNNVPVPRNNIPVSRPLVQNPQLSSVRRPLAPPIVTNASRPRPVIPGQRFPNVTIAGNPLQSIRTNAVVNRQFSPKPALVSNTVQAQNNNGLNNRQPTSNFTYVPVPIGNLFNYMPTTQQNTTNQQFTATNQLVAAAGRQSAVLQAPFRPAGGPRAVATFLVNSNQLANFGGRGIQLPPFMNSANQRTGPLVAGNQRLQTFIVRTTPGQTMPLSSIVNSTTRIQAPSNSLLPAPSNTIRMATSGGGIVARAPNKHPAPFPPSPVYNQNPKLKMMPVQPTLKGSRTPGTAGIILSWDMKKDPARADITNYQLFAYQESNAPITSALWKKVGDVKALPLPMACTLTQFIAGHNYNFTVRAVDIHGRIGPFSDAVTISYTKEDESQAVKK